MSGLQFTPIDPGDTSEIPPDAPPGTWEATCHVTLMATKPESGSLPMLKLEWKLLKDLVGGSEEFEGQKVTSFLVLRGKTDQHFKMFVRDLHNLCSAAGIEVPSWPTGIKSEDDVAEFIGELEGIRTKVWTIVKDDKRTGEKRTEIRYTAPGQGAQMATEAEDAPKRGKPAAKSIKGRRSN